MEGHALWYPKLRPVQLAPAPTAWRPPVIELGCERWIRNRKSEIAFSFSRSGSVHEFSRTIFNWALPTRLCRLITRHAVGTTSASRCKRYQLVCGIFRNSSGELKTRSTITSGKLPSSKRKSAALTASNAFRQRTQSKCRKAELSDEPGSKESELSINATKCRARCADRSSA